MQYLLHSKSILINGLNVETLWYVWQPRQQKLIALFELKKDIGEFAFQFGYLLSFKNLCQVLELIR